jgi:hypothetical protein
MLVNLGTGIVSPRVVWNKRSTCRRVDYGISGDVTEGNCLLNDKESQVFTRNSRGRFLQAFVLLSWRDQEMLLALWKGYLNNFARLA